MHFVYISYLCQLSSLHFYRMFSLVNQDYQIHSTAAALSFG